MLIVVNLVTGVWGGGLRALWGNLGQAEGLGLEVWNPLWGWGDVLCSTKEHFNESLKSVPPNVPWCGTCPCAVNNFSQGRGACCLLVKSGDSSYSGCMTSGGNDF